MNDSETSTPTTIIAAAREHFARHGYQGASVRAITAAAGANLGAITYHFGSKRELYDHVVGSVVAPLAGRVEAVAGGDGGVLERVGRVVEAYFEYLAANPDLPQLMTQELALSSPPPQAVVGPMKRVLEALTKLVLEGQARGEIGEGPAMIMSIFILSVPVHLGILRRTLAANAVLDLGDAAVRAEVTAAARRFVVAGLKGGM